MNGYELAAALRADPRTRGIVLVALTGYGRDPDRRRALDAGFDEHLVKPVEFDEAAREAQRAAGPRRGRRRLIRAQRIAPSSGARSKRPCAARSGAHKSPTAAIRAGMLKMSKSSMRAPASSSSQVIGAETVASGRGRGEYAEARVRPQAFWL